VNGDERAGRPDSIGRLLYFGKVPGRGDFVRSQVGAGVIHTLDQWVDKSLECLAADHSWKVHYDAAPAIDFVFLGTRRQVALAGRLAPSTDQSQRRYPFIAATSLQTADPIRLMALAPLLFAAQWTATSQLMQSAMTVKEPTEALAALADLEVRMAVDDSSVLDLFGAFLESETIGSLERALRAAGHTISVRNAVLALGLLLQPVLGDSAASLDRGLVLPLADESMAANVAAFWLNLVAPFLARGNFEVSLLFVRRPVQPILLASFDGASPVALAAALQKGGGDEFAVDLRDAEWVDDYVASDYGIKKLAGYMDMSGLSLAQASGTFKEAFLGL
jgi:type VI secretion system protein ImpM